MFETHQMLPLVLAVAGAAAMIIGFVADIFGISTGIRNMLRRPAPSGLDPPSLREGRREDGDSIAAGIAGGFVGGLVAGEVARHGHDNGGDASNVDDAGELDIGDAGDASDLGDLTQ
jgi:hypothetical protein